MYKIKAIWYNDLEQKVFCKCTHHLYQLYIYNNSMVVEEKWQRYIIENIETINNEIIELKSLFIMLFV